MQMTIHPMYLKKIIDEVVILLEKASHLYHIFITFSEDQFQGSKSKCHVLLSTDQQVYANAGTTRIKVELSPSKKIIFICFNKSP